MGSHQKSPHLTPTRLTSISLLLDLSSPPSSGAVSSLNTARMSLQDLDSEHGTPLRLALNNLLSTPVAEFTYAQIVDGMPVSDVYAEDHWFLEDWPVMQHEELCPGALEKTRAFRSEFDYLSLRLEAKVGENAFCARLMVLGLIITARRQSEHTRTQSLALCRGSFGFSSWLL